MCLSCPLGSVLAKNAESRRHLPDGQKTIPRVSPVFILFGGCSRGQCSPCLARTQSLIVHGKIPSPACGGRGSHEKNARIFFMGTREGGRRLEGGNTKPGFIPLGGRPQTPYLSRLAATHKLSIHPAWRPLTNPVFIPLGGHSQAQYLSRLARIQSRIVHGKIPSPACGGRWPQAGRGEYKTSVYPAWQSPINPALIPLAAFCLQKKPACAGFSRRGKTLYSVAMSITKRYLTSLFSIRS